KLAPTKGLPPRASFASAYDPVGKKVVLFGGFNANAVLNETWTFNGTTWTQANPKTVPAGASGPILFTDPASGHAIMFGGYRGQFYSRDTFRWTGTDWTLLSPSTSPYPR